ncbi:MAG: glucokinase [Alphaproteobacteria bacterium]
MATFRPLLLADVGGTHTRFAWIKSPGAALGDLKTVETGAFASFEAALGAYLAGLGNSAPSEIAIGAAGPLMAGRIRLTNAAWTIDPGAIAQERMGSVTLMNDLAAYAAGVAGAAAAGFETIVAGPQAPKDVLVVAIGTGIGAAIVRRRSGAAEVFPTEAGHMSFAPETEEEVLVLAAAKRVHKRVTFEHVASGSGLPTVCAALAHMPAHGAGAPADGAAIPASCLGATHAREMALHVAASAAATYIRALTL